jgi:hypothetical protein
MFVYVPFFPACFLDFLYFDMDGCESHRFILRTAYKQGWCVAASTKLAYDDRQDSRQGLCSALCSNRGRE